MTLTASTSGCTTSGCLVSDIRDVRHGLGIPSRELQGVSEHFLAEDLLRKDNGDFHWTSEMKPGVAQHLFPAMHCVDLRLYHLMRGVFRSFTKPSHWAIHLQAKNKKYHKIKHDIICTCSHQSGGL